MKRLFDIAALLLVLATPASAQSADEIQQSFIENYDALNAERDQRLKKLTDGYLRVLEQLIGQVKDTGNLDAVLPVRDEITAIQKGAWPLTELPATSPRQLGEYRQKYAGAREKIVSIHAGELVTLAGKMQALLEQREVDLTKAGEIDQALAVQRMRKSLAEDAGLQQAKRLSEQIKNGGVAASGNNRRIPAEIADQTFTFEGGSYYLFPKPMTYAEAVAACQEIGGILLSIDSGKKYDRFHNYSVENKKPLWIDLQDEAKDGDWRHGNGEKAQFLKWQSGEPNGDDEQMHVMIGFQGSWDMRDVGDNDRFHAICEW